MREQFLMFDRDGDGNLHFNEIRSLLKGLGSKLTDAQMQPLCEEMDVNNDGTIQMDEFLQYMRRGAKLKGKEPRKVRVQAKATPKPSRSVQSSQSEEKRAFRPKLLWQQEVLDAHNIIRALHGAPDLQWSNECHREARKQAVACEERGALSSVDVGGASGKHGQNRLEVESGSPAISEVLRTWHEQMAAYDFEKPGLQPGTEAFTQIVWVGTTHVGMEVSPDGKFYVAHYWPAGNCGDSEDFVANVLPKGTFRLESEPLKRRQAPSLPPSELLRWMPPVPARPETASTTLEATRESSSTFRRALEESLSFDELEM